MFWNVYLHSTVSLATMLIPSPVSHIINNLPVYHTRTLGGVLAIFLQKKSLVATEIIPSMVSHTTTNLLVYHTRTLGGVLAIILPKKSLAATMIIPSGQPCIDTPQVHVGILF